MYLSCFFFQAEDGIRDYKVTGVQTCALPILFILLAAFACEWVVIQNATRSSWPALAGDQASLPWLTGLLMRHVAWVYSARSEERRVGKECRSRWSPYH